MEKSEIATPYMLYCDFNQIFVAAERSILFEVNSIYQALLSVMGLYYAFDIQYPSNCCNTLLFIEKFILMITSGAEFTKSILGTVTDIKNVKIP